MLQINHNNLHLNYFGGSGGFLSFHLLLLSNHYANELNDCIDCAILNQWHIPDHSKWKSHETWPDNKKTFNMAGSPKLFYYCNRSESDWKELSGVKLLVYTDLSLQLALSRYKACWVYQKSIPAMTRDLDFHFKTFYNNVKDLAWPDCTTVGNSKNLPEHVQQELLTYTDYIDFVCAKNWDHWFIIKNQANKINNDIVYKDVAAVAKHSDLTIKLQDIVATNGKALLEPLGLPVMDQHVNLINKWKSLHSDDILSILTSTC
jgi:hypothetical protein